jgi:hypothetical protein
MLDLDHQTVFAGVARRYARAGRRSASRSVSAAAAPSAGRRLVAAGAHQTYIATATPRSEFLASLTDLCASGARNRRLEEAGGARHPADDTGQRVLSVSAQHPARVQVYYAITFSLQVGGERVITHEC